MGLINVVKTSSTSLGPLITGVLSAKGLFWIAFVMAGTLKATYDLGMLAVFATHVSREDKDKAIREEEEHRVESERAANGTNSNNRSDGVVS